MDLNAISSSIYNNYYLIFITTKNIILWLPTKGGGGYLKIKYKLIEFRFLTNIRARTQINAYLLNTHNGKIE